MDFNAGLDLKAIINSVLAGKLSVAEAQDEVALWQEFYSKPDLQLHMSESLLEQIQEIVVRNTLDKGIARIVDLAEVAAAAAGLLDVGVSGAVHHLTGERLWELNRPRTALAQYQKVPGLRPFCDRMAVEAQVRAIECLAESGDFAAAHQLCQERLSLIRECGFNGYLASALRQQAQCVARLGDMVRGAAIARDALRLREQLPAEVATQHKIPALSRFHERVAEIYREGCTFELALEAYERARQAALAEKDLRLAALMLSEIGICWERAGDRERGGEILRHAAKEATEAGHHYLADRWLVRDPKSQLESDDDGPSLFNKLTQIDFILRLAPERVLEVHPIVNKLLEQARERNDRLLEVEARSKRMIAYDIQQMTFAAELAGREALAVAGENGMRTHELMLMLNLTNIFARNARVDPAEEMAYRTIKLGEELRSQATSIELRQTITAGIITAYEYLAVLHGATVTYQYRTDKREPDPRRLLQLSQRCRSLDLASWLSISNLVEETDTAELIEHLIRFRAAEVAVEQESIETLPQLSPLVQKLTTARDEFGKVLRKPVPKSSEIEIEQLTEYLGVDDVLVDLLSVDPGATINCIAGNGRSTAILSGGWMREARAELLQGLARSNIRVGMILAEGRAPPERTSQTLRHHDKLLAKLNEDFLEYLTETILKIATPRRIIIAAHRDLFQVPFWQLSAGIPDARISIIPAPTFLPLLQQRKRTALGPRVGFGDPTGTLRHHRRELDTLMKNDFSVGAGEFTGHQLSDSAIIHFACHGVFDSQNPYRSGLLIRTAPESSGQMPFNSRMTVSEIVGGMQLRRCWLTVLSACETGLPRLHPASEFTSLPAAFLVVGARNVVASLWKVHDGATCLLMDEFYKALGKGADACPSNALQVARSQLRNLTYEQVLERLGSDQFVPRVERPFDHPVFVDAFQHYGID